MMEDRTLFVLWILVIVKNTYTATDSLQEEGCTTPPHPINGKVFTYADNLLAEYTCDDGFHMHGEGFAACILSEGIWTTEPPFCLAYGCPSPEVPRKGFVMMEKNNSIAKFSCGRGHFLMGGETTLYCLGNRWSGYAPICVASAVGGNPDGPQMQRNGTRPEERTYAFEDALRQSDQTCARYRYSAPPKIPNATFKTKYMFNEARRAWSSVANYTCDEGFMFVNNDCRYMFCRNYRWFAPVKPKCIKEVKTYDPCRYNRCNQVCIPGHGFVHACGCHRGYYLSPDGNTCKDINECLTNNGRCEQLCYNTLGSRFCSCHEGYMQVGEYCIDIDECKTTSHDCPGQCINTVGSYTCNCTGISGYLPGENRPCKDVDECDDGNGGCEAQCINTISSYRCRCKQKGFKLSVDRHNCTDVDECVRYGKKICHRGTCVNTMGAFHCDCESGFTFHKPSKQCIDIDECKSYNGGCEDECKNRFGSFLCICNTPGFQENNGSCIDLNECEVDNGGCEDECINTHGSYYCYCTEYGYIVDSNGFNCTNCKESEYINDEKKVCIPCPPHSHTVNYTSNTHDDCVCDDGFVGSPVDGVSCQDVDECSMGTILCDHGCMNTPGSAHCTCPDGYEVHNISSCIDIDECKTNSSVCNRFCENYDGYYSCYCGEGYELATDNFTCLDIDECNQGFNCSQICTNTNGSAECSCYKGYNLAKDNRTCEDINECELPEGLKCEDRCLNFAGSYSCDCSNPGYKLSWDDISCSDINECQEGVNHCEDVCQNTEGSFKCICNTTGFVTGPDGSSCMDFDECSSQDTNECDQICNNYPGAYNCSCKPGHIQKGFYKCEACPIDSFHDPENNRCIPCPKWSITTAKGQESMADCQCIDGYRGNLSLAIPCRDVNECEDDNFGCEQHCQNTQGSAYCSCRRGYNLDQNRKNCTDIDECRYKNHFCSDICENSLGSYTCSCRDGFKLYRDRKYCIDINECYGERNPCDQHCENTWGSYICGCVTRGYILAEDGHTCIENRPKITCPEDVYVEISNEALNVKVEIPSEIFAEYLEVSPDWIEKDTIFPVGDTEIIVKEHTSSTTKQICSFSVTVKRL